MTCARLAAVRSRCPCHPASPSAVFLHETNTFAPSKAGLDAFIQGGGWPSLARGEAVFEAVRNVNVGASGFVATARGLGWEMVPTLWCAASPSAHVTAEAFEALLSELG